MKSREELEMLLKTISQQKAKLETYIILKDKGLEPPPDLKEEIENL